MGTTLLYLVRHAEQENAAVESPGHAPGRPPLLAGFNDVGHLI